MDCLKCQNKNRSSSKFCRFCGEKVAESKTSTEATPLEFSFRSKIENIKKKLSPKLVIVILVILALSVTSVYAAPKVKDFLAVTEAIKVARGKTTSGDYKGALNNLNTVENRWSLNSQKQELIKLKSTEEKYIKYQDAVASSTEKEKSGSLTEAREFLQSVGSDYPKYEEVRIKLSGIQSKIEGNLEEKAKVAYAAKARAQADAEAATAAQMRSDASAAASAQQARDAEVQRQQAQAQAASAAQSARGAEIERKQAQAQAAVAEQSARDAEVQRQQAAIQRAEQVKRSFRNELTAGYNSYLQGSNYYSSAVQYSNSSNSLLAVSQAASARAVLNSARNTVSDLNSRYTGLSSDYYDAASNMVSAIDNLNNALDLLVSSEGTSLDYSSSINNYKNTTQIYAGRVKSFLDSNSY